MKYATKPPTESVYDVPITSFCGNPSCSYSMQHSVYAGTGYSCNSRWRKGCL